jgi:hypothetical protein
MASQITLEQLSRALAAHAMMVAYPHELHSALAPERLDNAAAFIFRFAGGERLGRPEPADLTCEPQLG